MSISCFLIDIDPIFKILLIFVYQIMDQLINNCNDQHMSVKAISRESFQESFPRRHMSEPLPRRPFLGNLSVKPSREISDELQENH